VTAARDGLAVHEAVREALAAELLAADPELHRRLRQQAWRHLSQEARTAPTGEMWRCTADLIHLIRNPVVREAFFPRDVMRFAVEPARPEDHGAILTITEAYDGHAAAVCLEVWLQAFPEAFFVARSPDHPVEGFYCLLDAAAAVSAGTALREDPVAARFAQHLRERPLPGKQTALFVRRWLGREEGERPSPVQAAFWLDVKRHYLERRPRLRRVYLTVGDLGPFAAAAGTLGFLPLTGDVPVGNQAMRTAVLDMGPGSVDGWLLRLAAEELGISSETGLLDQAKRALHADGSLVPLTRREFDVMAYLVAREGDSVSRDSLIEDVWGLRIDPGSNVVDAVVASLRRKLGGRSGVIETVRGFGYVYRAESESARHASG
jgi:DNA-binding winged helix-turn-helix (wHTH) protein